MSGGNRTLRYYRERLRWKAKKLNHPRPLQDYFVTMVGGKKKVIIADLGSSPFTTIGTQHKDIEVIVIASDILAEKYYDMMNKEGIKPVVPIEQEDMTALTYEDGTFDIVHCSNALDHTIDAVMALTEMCRVCKLGGWVYLRHYPEVGNHRNYKGMHKWNISYDGRLWNKEGDFDMSILGFETIAEDEMIINKWQKRH